MIKLVNPINSTILTNKHKILDLVDVTIESACTISLSAFSQFSLTVTILLSIVSC